MPDKKSFTEKETLGNEGSFLISSTGNKELDEAIANDEGIKAAGLDLAKLDKRLDELEAIYRPKSLY